MRNLLIVSVFVLTALIYNVAHANLMLSVFGREKPDPAHYLSDINGLAFAIDWTSTDSWSSADDIARDMGGDSQYNFFNGASDGVDAADMTFVGSYGSLSSYMYTSSGFTSPQKDGFKYVAAIAAQPDLFLDFHKTTANQKVYLLSLFKTPASYYVDGTISRNPDGDFSIGGTQSTGTRDGFNLRYDNSANAMRLTLGDGGSPDTEITFSSNSNMAVDTWYAVGLELETDGSNNMTANLFINGRPVESEAVASYTTTTDADGLMHIWNDDSADTALIDGQSKVFAMGNGDLTQTEFNEYLAALETRFGSEIDLTVTPSNVNIPTISGTNAVGEVLTAGTGDWNGRPDPTYTYQWQRDNVDISGETGTTYTVVSADEGTDITVEVTATNSEGSATAESNATSIPAGKPSWLLADLTPNSYPGSGQIWYSSSDTSYNFNLGADGTSEASDPTWNGTDGFTVDGGDFFESVNDPTTLGLDGIYQASGYDHQFGIVFTTPSGGVSSTSSLMGIAASGTIYSRLRLASFAGLFYQHRSGGSNQSTVYGTTPLSANTTYCVLYSVDLDGTSGGRYFVNSTVATNVSDTYDLQNSTDPAGFRIADMGTGGDILESGVNIHFVAFGTEDFSTIDSSDAADLFAYWESEMAGLDCTP